MTMHRSTVDRYPGTLAELVIDVANLRYDALEEFLTLLSVKLATDSVADEGRGRPRLASALRESAKQVQAASSAIREAWRISGPRMEG